MAITDAELDGFIGDEVVSRRQREQLRAALDRLPQDPVMLAELQQGVCEVVFETTSLADLAQAYHRARLAEREAMAVLTGAVIAESAVEFPPSEAELARVVRMQRNTVRKMLGK